MRLLYCKPSKHHLHAANKRASRNKNRRSASASDFFCKINAPTQIDLYRRQFHRETCEFIQEIKRRAKPGVSITLCFRNTTRITAAAALLLLAEVDSLLRVRRGLKLDCTLPPTHAKGKYQRPDYTVESALAHIGFFKLIGKRARRTPSYANVKCWDHLSGSTADGSLAGRLLKKIEATGTISSKARMRLYRGAFEAIANCVDHAYPGGVAGRENRWWMFVGVHDTDLAIIVCDLGVGIPATLPHKHSSSLLATIYDSLGLTGRSDGELIRASTWIKRTRTKEVHRGKGGADLRSLIEHYPEGNLSIYSRRGSFVAFGEKSHIRGRRNRKLLSKLAGGVEVSRNHDSAVHGTIIEWSLPLAALEMVC